MKKRLIMLMLSVCVTASFAACGTEKSSETKTEAVENGENTEDETGEAGSDEASDDSRLVSVAKKDMDKYIRLGEYKGIDVDKEVTEVTDADVEAQIETDLQNYEKSEYEDEAHTAIEGDTVNIDYVGTKDGEAFDGGTAEGYDLTLGSGSFIEGFEDGLIGAKKGEVRELNLTFPENYTEESLAGQDVVFTVTVNTIKYTPELSVEWVNANTAYDSVEAYRDSIRAALEENNETTAQNAAMQTAWSQVLEASEVLEYPQADIDAVLEANEKALAQAAEQAGQDVDEYFEETLNASSMTKEEYEEQEKQYAEDMVKTKLVVQAIMDEEGFTLEDQEFQELEQSMLEYYQSYYGYESIEELREAFGDNEVNFSVAANRVAAFVADNANMNTKVVTEDGKEDIVDADAEENEEE